MKLKTINKKGDIVLKEYTEQECRNILTERYSYVLKRVHSFGNDYGGSQHSEDVETGYDEINPESILVKDGHFGGVALIENYDDYNGGSSFTLREVALLIDGDGANHIRCGESFSNDDHSRWDYVDIYLIERPEDL